jgi:hypothetical protein
MVDVGNDRHVSYPVVPDRSGWAAGGGERVRGGYGQLDQSEPA